MKVYSIDLKLAATIYVKAPNKTKAMALAQAIAKDGYEFSGDIITDRDVLRS